MTRSRNQHTAQVAECWWLTTRLVSARIVHHGRYIVFQLAAVAVPLALFTEILRRIDQLRPKPTPLAA